MAYGTQLNAIKNSKDRIFLNGGAVILFYYSLYNLSNFLFLINGFSLGNTHQKTINLFENIKNFLPPPFNVKFFVKGWLRGKVQGNIYPTMFETKVDEDQLVKADVRNPERAVEQYFQGTAKWFCENYLYKNVIQICSKKNLLSGGQIRKGEARAIRDKYYKKNSSINFLQCIYRWRVRNNYRDPLYLLFKIDCDEIVYYKLESNVENILFVYEGFLKIVAEIGKYKTRENNLVKEILKDVRGHSKLYLPSFLFHS